MNMEIFVKEQCINSVHSVAIYLTLFSFSLKVLQPLMATAGGYISFAHFLLYLYIERFSILNQNIHCGYSKEWLIGRVLVLR